MRGATTTATLLALSSAALLASGSPAAAATVRWNVTLEGSIVQTGERTTRTSAPGGCTLERTERTSEQWTWKTSTPVAVILRSTAGGPVELTRGGRRGTIRIPVVVTASATSSISGTSSGSDADCSPGFGSSSLCAGSRPWTDLSVELRWNARSGRLESGPPAPTPAALRRRAGGCGTSPDGAASLGERPFPALVTSRAVSSASLLSGAAAFTRQAWDVAQRNDPGRGAEQRTVRALVRLTPISR